jgi:general secretion pathway protein D
VSMKLALEVSNILETITRASGTRAYRLGTRNTSTTLRVRDGETNVLAGLIQRDERRSNTGIPGLNEAPIISKLFGAAQDSDNRTEIVLLVTPRIVRNIELPGIGLQEFNAGTDAAVGAAPIQLGAPVVAPPRQVQPLSPPVQRPAPNVPSVPTQPTSPPPALTPPPLVPVSPGASAPGAPSR